MLLDDLAQRLASQSVGTLGSTIFLSSVAPIPTGSGPYLSLHETGGVAPTRIQNVTTASTQRPTVQILVRGISEIATRLMAKQAYAALDGIFNTSLGSIFYLKVTARQEPTDMGLDGAGRLQIVFNIDVEKAPS